MSRHVLLLMVFLCLMTTVAAQTDIVELQVNFKNIDTNVLLSNLPIVVEATNLNTGEQTGTIEYLDQDAELILELPPGNWEMTFTIQDPETQVTMYYLKRALNLQAEPGIQERTFYMIPTGSIEGTVYTSDDEVASGGDLEFDCVRRGVRVDYPDDISQFGTFEAPIATTGECTIFASADGEIGVETVLVEQGNISAVEIELNRPLTDSNNFIMLVAIVIILIIVGFVLFFKMKERWKEEVLEEVKEHQEEVRQETQEDKDELNPRARDVMKTLKEKEKEVVEFLLKQDGMQATQATTRNTTGIPKTTLARVFKSLENKNVVEIQKIGNMKKVKVTDWFLGKED